MNPEYLDKNLSQIFILWDKLFGSFQEELPDKPPVYGITRPAATWNPIKINYQHMWLLIKDAWHAKSVWDKLRIWFMPTGWRPADVIEKFPVKKVEDVYHFNKYETRASVQLHIWSWAQLITTLLFISYFFANIAQINKLHFSYIYLYGLFIFLSVYAYTELIDRNPFAIAWEITKNIFGLGLIFYMGDWFGSNNMHRAIAYCIMAYFLLSNIITAYFVYLHHKEDKITTLSF
jgi:alkylglycerol monooxygenase